MDKNNNSINLEPAELLLSGMCDFIKGSYKPYGGDTEKDKAEKLKKRKDIYKLMTPENLKKIIDRYEKVGCKIEKEDIPLEQMFAGFILCSIVYFEEELQLDLEIKLTGFSIYKYNGLTTGLIKFLEAQSVLIKNNNAYEKFLGNVYDKLFDREVMWKLYEKMNEQLPYVFGDSHLLCLLRALKFYPSADIFSSRSRLVAGSSCLLDQLAANIICKYYKKDSSKAASYLMEVLISYLDIDVACNLADYGLTKNRINSGDMDFKNLKEKYINACKNCPKEIEIYIMLKLNIKNNFLDFWRGYIYGEIFKCLYETNLAIWRDNIDRVRDLALDNILNIAGQVLTEMDYKSNLVDLLLNEPTLFEKDCNFIKILGPLVCLNRIDNENVANYLHSLFEKGIDDDKNTIKRMAYIINNIKLPDEKQKHVIEKLKEYGYDENKYQKLLLDVKYSNVHVPKQSNKRGKEQGGNIK